MHFVLLFRSSHNFNFFLSLGLIRYAAQVAYALTAGLRKLRASQRRARKAARKAATVALSAAADAQIAAVSATVAARNAFQNQSSGTKRLKSVARRMSMGRRRSSLDVDDVAVSAAAADALLTVNERDAKEGSPTKEGGRLRPKSPQASQKLGRRKR